MHETSSTSFLTAVRRFATLVVLAAVVCGAAAAALASRSAVSYSADATYLVPPGATGSAEALSPYDAERIARTYAVVLSEDEDLLGQVGSAIGQSEQHVADRISALALPNSSAIRVSYHATSRAEVRDLFDALTSQATSASPPTANLRPSSLSLLRAPTTINASGRERWVAGLAGAVAGLLLGLGAASWLGRALPRVYQASDLREPGGPSVVDVDLRQPVAVDALAVRLLDGLPEGAWVAVLAATREAGATAEDLATRLADAVRGLVAREEIHESLGAAQWIPTRLGDGGERIAQDAERTLVVVPRGSDLRTVAARLSDLRDLGAADVVLSVTRPAGRRAARREPGAARARALGPAESA